MSGQSDPDSALPAVFETQQTSRKRTRSAGGSPSANKHEEPPRIDEPAKKISRTDGFVDEPIHIIGNLAFGETIDSSCAFVTLSQSTHEICRTEAHLSGLPDLIARLDTAVKAAEQCVRSRWRARDSYTRTSVLLLSWADDDLRVKLEIRQLRSLFQDSFNYEVCEWELPSGPGVYLKTVNRVGDFAAQYGGEGTLLIIYYGGHGYLDIARPTAGPIWVSRRRRYGETENPAELESSGLSPILAEQDGDVLLIFDCCQAVPSIIRPRGKGVVSAISATGFESGTLGVAPEPGIHSFTYSLVDELAASANLFRSSANPRPISDIELHVNMVNRLRQHPPSVQREADGSLRRDRNNLVCFEPQHRRTPHHQFLSAGRDPKPIYLRPAIQKPSDSPDSGVDPGSAHDANPTSPPPIRMKPAPMVLVRVMLSGEDFDVESWASWVLKCPQVAVDVRIEGQWGSFSTLQILRLPLHVWDLVPQHPAISFLGFVTTENQAQALNEAVSARVADLKPKDTTKTEESGPASTKAHSAWAFPHPANLPSVLPSFTDTEKRFLLGEMIKTSYLEIDVITDFIRQHGAIPDWLTMQLPNGRNMSQCMKAAEAMFNRQFPIPSNPVNPWSEKVATSVPHKPATGSMTPYSFGAQSPGADLDMDMKPPLSPISQESSTRQPVVPLSQHPGQNVVLPPRRRGRPPRSAVLARQGIIRSSPLPPIAPIAPVSPTIRPQKAAEVPSYQAWSTVPPIKEHLRLTESSPGTAPEPPVSTDSPEPPKDMEIRVPSTTTSDAA